MRPSRLVLAATLAFSLPAPAASPPAAVSDQPVDVELVLMVDGSASVSDHVLAFQLAGHAAALRDPAVAAAIAGGEVGAVAVTLVSYSSPNSLATLVPWTRLAGAKDAAAFADAVAAAGRDQPPGSTALGSGLAVALGLFADNGYAGLRRTVDLTGNGFSNAGIAPERARDLAASEGVAVNALAILNQYPWLADYYRQSVVTGPDAFVAVATDRDSFIAALARKLVREIGPVA